MNLGPSHFLGRLFLFKKLWNENKILLFMHSGKNLLVLL